jgi:hypothetical protein
MATEGVQYWRPDEYEMGRAWSDFFLGLFDVEGGSGQGVLSLPGEETKLWFGTLTFREVCYPGQTEWHEPGAAAVGKAARSFADRWLDRGTRGQHVLVVEERGERRGRRHLHYMGSGSDRIAALALADHAKKSGFVQKSEVAAPAAAAAYVSKYIAKQPDGRWWFDGT